VVFGGDARYPPFEWIDEAGTARGFNVDLARAVSRAGGRDAEHRLLDWPEVLRALDRGEVDAVAMFHSESREARYRFTAPFFHVDHAVFGGPGASPVADLDNLSGARIAVEARSYAHDRLEAEAAHLSLVLKGNTLDALRAVVAGEAEYAVLSAPAGDQLIRVNNLNLHRMGPTFWPRPYVFAVRRDRPAFAAWLDRALQASISTGSYGRVYARWQSSLVPGLEEQAWKRRLLWGAVAAIAMLALAGIWLGSLKRTVRARTSDLEDALHRREVAEQQARHAADFDQHGLCRPHLFRARIDDAIAHGFERLEVWTIQIEAFDKVIRTLDQSTAMALVEAFAERLKSLGFIACGRLSRARFAIVTNGALEDRQRQALAQRIKVRSFELYPDIRMGGAQWPRDADAGDGLLRCAEIALMCGVEVRRAHLRYQPDMDGNPEDLRLTVDFQASHGAGVHAVFQPLIDVRSGQITGAEALARWRHPELGPISPGRFVPLLERSGLISVLTERMVDEAIRVGAHLRRLLPAATVSVNVTPYDLLDPTLPHLVQDRLLHHAMPAEALKLELTETSVVTDPEGVCRAMRQLQAMGVTLSVDDFGTGHASLSYLTSFPFGEGLSGPSFPWHASSI
jgi:EAL domain-containing protein (putative c-di-GMP-specific phosphodiesterase class I)/ABC-type amino acid transport substrate-binding protein